MNILMFNPSLQYTRSVLFWKCHRSLSKTGLTFEFDIHSGSGDFEMRFQSECIYPSNIQMDWIRRLLLFFVSLLQVYYLPCETWWNLSSSLRLTKLHWIYFLLFTLPLKTIRNMFCVWIFLIIFIGGNTLKVCVVII
jgi:hypothetical protein